MIASLSITFKLRQRLHRIYPTQELQNITKYQLVSKFVDCSEANCDPQCPYLLRINIQASMSTNVTGTAYSTIFCLFQKFAQQSEYKNEVV